MFGNALAEKPSDICACRHLLEFQQTGEIEFRLGFRDRLDRDNGFRGRRVATLFRLVLALRPSRQKSLVVAALAVVAHDRPVPSSGGPSGARARPPPARSRLRLWKTRSTWN